MPIYAAKNAIIWKPCRDEYGQQCFHIITYSFKATQRDEKSNYTSLSRDVPVFTLTRPLFLHNDMTASYFFYMPQHHSLMNWIKIHGYFQIMLYLRIRNLRPPSPSKFSKTMEIHEDQNHDRISILSIEAGCRNCRRERQCFKNYKKQNFYIGI